MQIIYWQYLQNCHALKTVSFFLISVFLFSFFLLRQFCPFFELFFTTQTPPSKRVNISSESFAYTIGNQKRLCEAWRKAAKPSSILVHLCSYFKRCEFIIPLLCSMKTVLPSVSRALVALSWAYSTGSLRKSPLLLTTEKLRQLKAPKA